MADLGTKFFTFIPDLKKSNDENSLYKTIQTQLETDYVSDAAANGWGKIVIHIGVLNANLLTTWEQNFQ